MTDPKSMLRNSLFAILATITVGFAAQAEDGDPSQYMRVDQGADLAGMWCNACHVVSDERQATGKDAAPPFPVLAPLVKADPDRYRVFLKNPHSPMREIALSRDEIEALIAYMQSQDPAN